MRIAYLSHALMLAIILASSAYILSSGVSAPPSRFGERATLYAEPACACRVKTITLDLNNTGTVPIVVSEILVNGTSITGHNFPPDHMEIATDYMFGGDPVDPGHALSFKIQIGSGWGEVTMEVSVVSQSGRVYTSYAHLID